MTVTFSVGLSVSPTSESPEMSLAVCLKETVSYQVRTAREKRNSQHILYKAPEKWTRRLLGAMYLLKDMIGNGNCIIKVVRISNFISFWGGQSSLSILLMV